MSDDGENHLSMHPGQGHELNIMENVLLEDPQYKVRVFCVSCEKRAEVIKLGEREALMRFLHVRCHGEELICWLPEIVTRRKTATTRDREHIDLLWNDLHAIDTLERIDHAIQRVGEDLAKCDDLLSLEQPPETDAYVRKARAERQTLLDAMQSVRRNIVERQLAKATTDAGLIERGIVEPGELSKEP